MKPGPKPKAYSEAVMAAARELKKDMEAAAFGFSPAQVYAEVPYGDGSTGRKFYTPAQILALRIWEGQSPDVPVIERVARIANGLKAQGFGVDVTLPHPDAERYMKAHL